MTDDWAHGIWEAVAITLAHPLRKALDEHLDAHGCGCSNNNRGQCTDLRHINSGGHKIGGFSRCDEAYELWLLLPDGDRVVVAAIPFA